MKAMEAELGMYKQQVDVFKSDIEAAGDAMRNLCQRWVAEQRRIKKQSGGQLPGVPTVLTDQNGGNRNKGLGEDPGVTTPDASIEE